MNIYQVVLLIIAYDILKACWTPLMRWFWHE